MGNVKKIITNFSNKDMSNMDFKGYDFDKGMFYGTNFSNSSLEGVNLRGANFKHSILINTNLRNANLTGALLNSANLSGADLTGAILISCNLQSADFKDAIKTDADFQFANIKKAKNLVINTEFIKVEDFIENSAKEYEVETIITFLKENNITIDKFRYIGKCDCDCQACGKNNYFSIWRNDIFYDEDNNHFTFEENNNYEMIDFSIYICEECGKWNTWIY